MKITDDIRLRLTKAVDYFGSQTILEKKAGLKPSSISNWLKKNYKSIDHENWMKIEPFLYGDDTPSPHLKPHLSGSYAEAQRNDVSPVPALLKDVPVISVAQAAGYDTDALCPMIDYVKEVSDNMEGFDADFVKDGYFALTVDGDSMSPDLPHGTILLVGAGEFPERGDIVVAKFAESGQVVCKRYYRKSNVISLSSVNPTGQNFTWNIKEEPGKLNWMFPVRHVKVDLRIQRWEKQRLKSLHMLDEEDDDNEQT